ncbi:MAG: sigma 54-interacting transcriptional regulator [Methylocystaceae bacterium]
MLVKDIMTRQVITLDTSATLRQAAEYFLQHHIDGAPVINQRKLLVGLITKNHLIRALNQGINPDSPVEAVMTKQVITVSPNDDITGLLNIKVGRLPVIEKSKVVGIITRTDLAAAYYENLFLVSSELNTLLNALHNPVVSIDNLGNVQTCNKAFLDIFDLKNYNQLVGKPIKSIDPENTLLDVLTSGRPEVAQKVVYQEKTYVSNQTLMRRDDKIIGAVGVFQDISELESISQELEYTKSVSEELNAIIESSFDGIFVTDAQGLVLRVNKAYERITGISGSDIIGRSMDDLVEEGLFNRSVTLQVIQDRQPVTITQEVKGNKVILVTGNPIFDIRGNVIRVVTNVRDITELNQLQRRLEAIHSLSDHYRQELQALRLQLDGKSDIVVRSPKMQEVYDLAIRLAGVDSTVLISGESGVGKELVADVIHKNSKRKENPYIKINCGAIPESLLESELFGYEGGAFSGARKEGKAGLFEVADEGSIFLDEISEMPLNLQVKLLRVLQERSLVRVGGVHPIDVNVRIIAATNRDLEVMVKEQRFRQDLYYRLNVVPVTIPPLRQRKEEIPALAYHFFNKYNRKYSLNCEISEVVINSLTEYDWPGNVRELENIIERLLVTSKGCVIDLDNLPSQFRNYRGLSSAKIKIQPLKKAVDNLEKDLLTEAFKEFKTTRRVAQVLGIDQSTVVRKAARFELNIDN